MQLPLDEYMQTTSQNRAQHLGTTPVRLMTTWKLLELKNSSKPLGNLLNAYNKPKHAQNSPLVDNA
jgi:hypothetical protein